MEKQLAMLLVVGGVGVVVFIVLRMLELERKRRREALLRMRFDEKVRREIAEDFAIYGRLPNALRDELDGLMHVFLSEKGFEPCGGLEEVTEQMQRVIAAQACLLLLRTPHQFYKNLRSILIYPDAYTVHNSHGGNEVRLGESWDSGSVVLSWSSVLAGGRNPHDGQDVTLHEFAHQLDQAGGPADGAPLLRGHGAYRAWAAAFRPAFESHQKRVAHGKSTVMDAYGAENPAEFFAVATETFFEKPEQLQENSPELYAQLQQYYGLNPLEWVDEQGH